jgi:large subunit ribosomal protein L1
MKTRSKRYIAIQEKIEDRPYAMQEAITTLQSVANARFQESIDVNVSLNIDPKYADQQLRATLILPEGTGQAKRIAALVEEDQFEQAKKAGADIVGSDDLIDEITKGVLDFEILITTPKLMPKLAKLGKVLGPKGLMPSPKTGTITTNLDETIEEFKRGKIEYRADKHGNVHINFGKTDFSSENLVSNLKAVFESLEKNRPSGVKGKYMKKFTVSTTMSPSIELDLETLK